MKKTVKLNRKITITIIVISAALLITELSIFFNDVTFYKNQNYMISQTPEMTDYLLGNYTLFDDDDIEYIKNAQQYSEANSYDLTNIALRGCDFYYDYLRTNNQKYVHQPMILVSFTEHHAFYPLLTKIIPNFNIIHLQVKIKMG